MCWSCFKCASDFNKTFVLCFLKKVDNSFLGRRRIIPNLKAVEKNGDNTRNIDMSKVVRGQSN